MSQNNSNDKAAMLAKIEGINKVDGFDPAPFAVELTDLNSQETRKRLPVMIQMAWFRLKYPEGKIAVSVTPAKDCFVATARVYPNFQNAQIGYTFPEALTRKIKISKLRLYVAADNIFYVSARQGFDPRYSFTGETSYTTNSTIRTVSGGINITF